MNGREKGFLLLGSNLGNPNRKPLTTAQMRTLAQRMAVMEKPKTERELTVEDILALGYGAEMAQRIFGLLSEEALLKRYLSRGRKASCTPLTRVTQGYPLAVRQRLGLEAPGVLWAKGELSILERPKIALVGSRDLHKPNEEFARKVGIAAARQGYVLVSGNARGADRAAQRACLEAGGQGISVVADSFESQHSQKEVLYLSEEGFDLPFTATRAHSRNRVIHALGEMVFVAQASLGTGGTWAGTVQNLKYGWSPVYCCQDGAEATVQLCQMGAQAITPEALDSLSQLHHPHCGFL